MRTEKGTSGVLSGGAVNDMERLTRRIGNSIDFVAGKGYANMSHEDGVRLLFKRLAAYENTGKTPEEVAALVQAESEGRLVVLSEPMIPLVCSDDMEDSDVYCPKCGKTLSGGWEKAEVDCSLKLCQCFHCGQSIDDSRVITREAAEAMLQESNRNESKQL